LTGFFIDDLSWEIDAASQLCWHSKMRTRIFESERIELSLNISVFINNDILINFILKIEILNHNFYMFRIFCKICIDSKIHDSIFYIYCFTFTF
jgi:hypothetical protein